MIVVPGAGRNGDDYRDSWIEASEKYSILILSLSYPEKHYDYAGYHLAGVVKDLHLSKGVLFKENSNQVLLDEDIVEFSVDLDQEHWLFSDFDRLFEIVGKKLGSKQKNYDMFGHSAGGQILHRFVLLRPESRADRILASNAGTYTMTDGETDFPFGLNKTGVDPKWLKKSFRKNLVLFLGQLDNDDETRGRMLRSETADLQGTNRLDRGKNFFRFRTKYREEFWNQILLEIGDCPERGP